MAAAEHELEFTIRFASMHIKAEKAVEIDY